MNDTNTSRTPVMDVVELVANLIASYSHLFELYNDNEVFIKGMKEEGGEEFEQRLGEMELLEKYIDKVYSLRKEAMSIIKDLSPEYNYRAHCLLKHAIASYQYASELRDTDRNNTKYQTLVFDCAQYMYSMLSFYMGVDTVTCGRCLLDALGDDDI